MVAGSALLSLNYVAFSWLIFEKGTLQIYRQLANTEPCSTHVDPPSTLPPSIILQRVYLYFCWLSYHSLGYTKLGESHSQNQTLTDRQLVFWQMNKTPKRAAYLKLWCNISEFSRLDYIRVINWTRNRFNACLATLLATELTRALVLL